MSKKWIIILILLGLITFAVISLVYRPSKDEKSACVVMEIAVRKELTVEEGNFLLRPFGLKLSVADLDPNSSFLIASCSIRSESIVFPKERLLSADIDRKTRRIVKYEIVEADRLLWP